MLTLFSVNLINALDEILDVNIGLNSLKFLHYLIDFVGMFAGDEFFFSSSAHGNIFTPSFYYPSIWRLRESLC